MRRAPLLTAGGLALLVAGCGSTNVDTAKMERQLRSTLAAQAKVDPGAVKVDCPRDETAEQGRTFTCTVSYRKHRRTVDIRLEANDTYSATVRTEAAP